MGRNMKGGRLFGWISQYDPYRRKYDEASIQYGERLAKTTIGTSGIMRTPSSF